MKPYVRILIYIEAIMQAWLWGTAQFLSTLPTTSIYVSWEPDLWSASSRGSWLVKNGEEYNRPPTLMGIVLTGTRQIEYQCKPFHWQEILTNNKFWWTHHVDKLINHQDLVVVMYVILSQTAQRYWCMPRLTTWSYHSA